MLDDDPYPELQRKLAAARKVLSETVKLPPTVRRDHFVMIAETAYGVEVASEMVDKIGDDYLKAVRAGAESRLLWVRERADEAAKLLDAALTLDERLKAVMAAEALT